MGGKIIVVGVGYGDERAIPLGTLDVLENDDKVYLRTEKHPVVSWLKNRGILFSSLDALYEVHEDFESVYEGIAALLLKEARNSVIVYAVPGHPMVAERAVQLLLHRGEEQGVEVDICGGGSFLDIAFSRMRIDPIEGFLFLDGTDLDEMELNPRVHLLLGQVYSRMVASDVKLTLMEKYPDEHVITIARSLGVEGREEILKMPLYEMDRGEYFDDLTSVYVPPVKL